MPSRAHCPYIDWHEVWWINTLITILANMFLYYGSVLRGGGDSYFTVRKHFSSIKSQRSLVFATTTKKELSVEPQLPFWEEFAVSPVDFVAEIRRKVWPKMKTTFQKRAG